MNERDNAFTLKDVIFNLLFIVLFVFILLWLFPSKSFLKDNYNNNEATTNQIFNHNIETMKDAAVSYFTTERLPKKVGDQVSLTLRQMRDKKLLLSLIDSKGNVCDEGLSYVEITKDSKDEYILKVSLSCSDNEDYILVHLGCYDYCEGDVCEKDEPIAYKYQYKLEIPCKLTDWSAWSAWSTTYVQANSNRKVETQSSTSTIDATITNTCQDGYLYNQSTGLCYKNISNVDVKDAEKVINYSCSINGTEYYITKNGEYLLNNGQKVENINVLETDTNKYACMKTETKQAERGEDKVSCESYNTQDRTYVLNGTSCIYEDRKAAEKNQVTYSCPSGYTLNGTTCTKTYSEAYPSTCTTQATCYKEVCTTKNVPTFINGIWVNIPQTSCTTESYSCTKTYSCTKYRTVTDSKAATPSPVTYNCNKYAGYSLSGTTCIYNDTKTAIITPTYYCLSNGLLNGTSCLYKYNKDANLLTTYNCSKYGSDYALDGTTCKKITNSSDTTNPTKSLTCPSGYTLSGTKCKKDIIYYRFSERGCTGGSVDYQWSLSNTDEELIKKGYVLTGIKEENISK